MSTLAHRVVTAVLRRWRWVAAAAASLAVYAALGFLLLPYVLQRVAPARLEEALGRKVVIERIRTNPFTLSLTIDGFAVLDQDGRTPALSWRSIFVDYELWPIVKHEQHFSAIRLVQPAVRGGLRRDGTPSFADVAERLQRREAAGRPAPGKEGKPWTIAVDDLDIDAASVEFRDASRAAPFESRIGPVTLHVESFRTTSDGRSPYTFSGQTEAGETFSWTGTFRVVPIRSSGTLVLDNLDLPKYAPYYSDVLLAQVRQGRAMLRATYELDLGPDRVVRLLDGELRVRGVALHDRADGEPILSLPELDVTGIRVDAPGNAARVDRIEARGGVLSVRRDGDGGLNLARIMAPATPAPEAHAKPAPHAPATPDPQAPAARPLRYDVGTVALSGWRVELEDRMPPRPVELALTDVAVTLGGLRSAPGNESPLTVSLTWPGGGKLRLEGSVSATRPSATIGLEADALALPPVEPYLALYGGARARVTEGKLGGKLRATLDLSRAEAPSYAVSGDAAVDGLVLLDEHSEEAVRWRTVEAKGIDVRSAPAGAQLGVLRIVEPRLRIVRRPDQTTNLAGMAGPPEPAVASTATTKASSQAAPDAGAAKGNGKDAMPFRIGTIAVERGLVTVTDRSIAPPAVLRYTQLRARLTGFSSDASARTGVDVEALVEGSAPFRIAGTLNPRLVGDVTNVTVRSKGIDLTPFGPYSRRYMGYALERGKMDLDMRYRVKHRNLKAENVVRIDQLSLGEKTDSPDAPHFPMGLALAVLTDRDGVMLLDVPAEGNLDDPEFKLGRVIWHAILNVLGKVATAPFTAIAGLFGGDANTKLDVIDFSAGSAQLDDAARGKLDQLAKALQQRPGLKLEVEGVVDASTDGAAIGRAAVRAIVAREKWQRSRPTKGEAAPATPVISDEEYPRYLKLAYESALREQPAQAAGTGDGSGAPPDGASAPAVASQPAPAAAAHKPGAPTPEEMEAFLLKRVDVEAAMRNLSSERAAAVRDQLLERQIDQSRLFLAESGGKDPGGPSVRLKLR